MMDLPKEATFDSTEFDEISWGAEDNSCGEFGSEGTSTPDLVCTSPQSPWSSSDAHSSSCKNSKSDAVDRPPNGRHQRRVSCSSVTLQRTSMSKEKRRCSSSRGETHDLEGASQRQSSSSRHSEQSATMRRSSLGCDRPSRNTQYDDAYNCGEEKASRQHFLSSSGRSQRTSSRRRSSIDGSASGRENRYDGERKHEEASRRNVPSSSGHSQRSASSRHSSISGGSNHQPECRRPSHHLGRPRDLSTKDKVRSNRGSGSFEQHRSALSQFLPENILSTATISNPGGGTGKVCVVVYQLDNDESTIENPPKETDRAEDVAKASSQKPPQKSKRSHHKDQKRTTLRRVSSAKKVSAISSSSQQSSSPTSTAVTSKDELEEESNHPNGSHRLTKSPVSKSECQRECQRPVQEGSRTVKEPSRRFRAMKSSNHM